MCGKAIVFVLVGLGILLVISLIVSIGSVFSSPPTTTSERQYSSSEELIRIAIPAFFMGIAVSILAYLVLVNVLPNFFGD